MSEPVSIDARALRRCLGQFGTGVTVITAQVGVERVGVTVNSFSSLSLDPPLVLWSIKRTSRSFDVFQAAEHFAVNILSSEQIQISQAFSSSGTDKFSGIDWTVGKTGSPIISGNIATIECRVYARHDGGDHIILIGHVDNFRQSPGEALLFFQGRYAVAIDHPQMPLELGRQPNDPLTEEDPSFWTLMFLALHRMSRRFERHREEQGLNADQTRVLIDVFDNPGCSTEQLVAKSFLRRGVAEDAISALVERGYLSRDAAGALHLTDDGVRRRQIIFQRWTTFERGELAGVAADDIESARRVMTRILEHSGIS
ncbi:flavin reductase [Bradyrhizobium prioriisuperbiae]|uniref:flavin reductase n=1 Tax=Bradyrhizobium prioriisuperbiae TaxID=2854389 RepID=UPI0028EF80C2|nr:flavin reductase [Bradyrhizobium prioritasuperba]